MEGAEPAPTGARPRRVPGLRPLRIIGVLVAALAVGFCVRAISRAWPEVRASIAHANAGWLIAAFVLSAAAMTGLGLLWWRCLHLFGVPVRPGAAIAWYFGGELGKYLPGGIWTVVGRGELARRGHGVHRGVGYATTLISYACMCVAAAVVCGALAPVAAARGGGLGWGWALLALIPLGAAAVHPAVLGPALRVGRRISRGRLDLTPPDWPAMLRLIGWAVPTWLLLGAASTLVTLALHLDQEPSRVAFAAVAAWIIGFLAVPVPAGAGVREVVFVLLCGLPAGPATAVAAIARALLLIVDAAGGVAGLAHAGRSGDRA